MDDLPDGDLKGCGCGPGKDEVRGLSGLARMKVPEIAPVPVSIAPMQCPPCPPCEGATSTAQYAPRMQVVQTMPTVAVPRVRKPRSKGNGEFCVFSHKDKVVHCYSDEGKAKRVARSFGERTGTKFVVKRR